MRRRGPACAEADLYPAVKAFFEGLGYDVKAEVRGCDVVAIRAAEPPVIVELKLAFSLGLVLQGVDRLTGQSVALIVKRRSKAAGLGPEQLSGHSLRAGYVTAAAAAGVEERKIANVTRHKHLTLLRHDIRTATA